MATTEEITLGPVDREIEDVLDGSHIRRAELLEQDDTTDSRQGISPSTKEAAGKVTTSRWKKVSITVTTSVTYLFLYAGISMIAPFYPIEAQQHSVPTYIAGFVVATGPLCLALTSPLVGSFLPYLGVKFTQLAGLLWAGGSLILFGFVSMMPTPTLFLVFSFLLRMVEGVGTGMFTTVSYTILTQLYPDKKGTVISSVQLCLSLGYAIGPAIGGGLQEAGGFVLPFLVVGGSIVVLMLVLTLLVQPTGGTSVKLPWRLALRLFSNPVFVLLVVSLLLVNSSCTAITTYLGKFLYTQFKISVGVIGAIYLVSSLSYAVGTITAGQLTDRLKAPRCLNIVGLLVIGTGCAFLGPAPFITTPKLWLTIISLLVAPGGMSFAVVPVYSDMSRIATSLHSAETDIASTVSGVFIGCISGGECLGSIVGGFLVYKVGFPSLAAILSLILLVCALVLVIVTVFQRVWKLYCRNSSDKVA